MTHLRRLLLVFIVNLLFVAPVFAASFTTDIEDGILKKNSISTTHFQFEFSNLIKEQQDSDNDGIADIIEVLADSAEESWNVIINQLNYDQPTLEYPKILVVLDDLDEYLFYGSVGVTSLLSSGDPFIAILPWLSQDYLQITMAHEFFHAVQFSYDTGFATTFQGVNWAEASATWVEDVVYNDVNDYLNYFTDFFDYVDYSVFASIIPTGTLYQYALNIWPTFLAEYYNDNDVILEIWENYFNSPEPYSDDFKIYNAVVDVIESRGDTLPEVFQVFSLWNLDITQYDEGADFPDVLLLEGFADNAYYEIDEEFAPALYGTNYLLFENVSNAADFNFHIIKPDSVSFGLTLIPLDNGILDLSNRLVTIVEKNDELTEELTLSGMANNDGVVAIISPLEKNFSGSNGFTFDEGQLYFYAADFGNSLAGLIQANGQGLAAGTNEKEGQEITESEVKGPDSLILTILDYDKDSITFSWNRPSGANLTGYELNYGTSPGNYNQSIVIDKAFTTFSTVDGLVEDLTYYFQLESFNGGSVLLESSEVTITPMEWIFSDLSYLDPYYDSVSNLVDGGVFSGYPDGTFHSEWNINRAELLKILIEGQDLTPDANIYRNCFPDVASEWYAPYVCFAEAEGWVQGYPDGTFKPGNTVNKVEALKILFNVYQEGLIEGSVVAELPYSDLNTSAWYAIYTWKASKLGILQETVGANFNPSEGRIRGDMANILNSYLVIKGLN